MGIEQKSVGGLIDELCTTVIKCFLAQEVVMKGGTDAEVAEAARRAQGLNARRNQLMRAIDAYFGDENAATEKTYTQPDDSHGGIEHDP